MELRSLSARVVFSWANVVILSPLCSELGRKPVDPVKKKVAVDNEASAAAALYATADNARKRYYTNPATAPVHNLGKEIVQAFNQVRRPLTLLHAPCVHPVGGTRCCPCAHLTPRG